MDIRSDGRLLRVRDQGWAAYVTNYYITDYLEVRLIRFIDYDVFACLKF